MSLGSPHSSGRGQRGCRCCLRPHASGRGRHSAAGPGPDAAARLPGAGARRTCAGARVAEVGPAGALRTRRPGARPAGATPSSRSLTAPLC